MPTGFEPANIGMKTLGVKPLLNGTACPIPLLTNERIGARVVFSLTSLTKRCFTQQRRRNQKTCLSRPVPSGAYQSGHSINHSFAK